MSGFLNLFRVPEIRNKILLTMGLLLAYRIGFHIPLPGVDLESTIEASSELAPVLESASMVLYVSPSQATRAVLQEVGPLPACK